MKASKIAVKLVETFFGTEHTFCSTSSSHSEGKWRMYNWGIATEEEGCSSGCKR
jgi:hypothetical protein